MTLSDKSAGKLGIAAFVSVIGAAATALGVWLSTYETGRRVEAAAASAQAPLSGALALTYFSEFEPVVPRKLPPTLPRALTTTASFQWGDTGSLWVARVHARCSLRPTSTARTGQPSYVGILTDGVGRPSRLSICPQGGCVEAVFFDGRIGGLHQTDGAGSLSAEGVADSSARDANWDADAQPTGFVQSSAGGTSRARGSVRFRTTHKAFLEEGGEIGCLVVADSCPIDSVADAEAAIARNTAAASGETASERVSRLAAAICEGPMSQRAWGSSTTWFPTAQLGGAPPATSVRLATSAYAEAVQAVTKVAACDGPLSAGASAASANCRAAATSVALASRDALLPLPPGVDLEHCDVHSSSPSVAKRLAKGCPK